MGTDILTRPAAFDPARRPVKDYLAGAYAGNTQSAYRTAWAHFCAWAGAPDPRPVAPARVLLYLQACAEAGTALATLRVRIAAIRLAHEAGGLATPTDDKRVSMLLRGVAREQAGRKAKAPRSVFGQAEIKALDRVLADDTSNRGRRDRALILCGLFGAFRAGELVGLIRGQLSGLDKGGGYVVRLGATKTDPAGARHKYKLLPKSADGLSPGHVLADWLACLPAGAEQPVFCAIDRQGRVRPGNPMSRWGATLILRQRTEQAGLGQAYDLTALRRSYVTLCRDRGIEDRQIIYQTHHLSVRALEHYDAPDRQDRLQGAALLLASLNEEAVP